MRNASKKSAAVPSVPVPTRVEAPDCYGRLVSEIATLECVMATLSGWDLMGQPTDGECRIGSAELVLRQLIGRLNDLAGDLQSMQDQLLPRIEAEVASHG